MRPLGLGGYPFHLTGVFVIASQYQSWQRRQQTILYALSPVLFPHSHYPY